MDLDVLKVFTSTYISESDITLEKKLELIDFIKEADKDAVLSLMILGSPILVEDISQLLSTEIFIETLILQELPRLTKTVARNIRTGPYGVVSWDTKKTLTGAGKGVVAVAAAVVVAAVAAAAYMVYKRYFSKAAKACKGKSGEERTLCVKKFKMDAIKAQISTLNSGMSKCSKTKNPDKCKAKLQKKIAPLKSKLGG